MASTFKHCPNGIDVELWSMEGVPHPPFFFGVGPNGMKTLAEKSWKFLRSHNAETIMLPVGRYTQLSTATVHESVESPCCCIGFNQCINGHAKADHWDR